MLLLGSQVLLLLVFCLCYSADLTPTSTYPATERIKTVAKRAVSEDRIWLFSYKMLFAAVVFDIKTRQIFPQRGN